MDRMTVAEAKIEYKNLIKSGMHLAAQTLREQYIFWNNIDISR